MTTIDPPSQPPNTLAPAAAPIDEPAAGAPIPASWGFVLILGVLTALAGVAVIAWPGATLLVVAVLFGVWLASSGVMRVVGALLDKQQTTGIRVLEAVVGLALIVAGVVCLANLLTSLAALVFVVGVSLMIDAVGDLVGAFGHHSPHSGGRRAWLVLTGLLGLAAGFIIISRPGLGLAVVVALLGTLLIVVGIARITAAFALRSLGRHQPGA